jgi:hypothetical protein
MDKTPRSRPRAGHNTAVRTKAWYHSSVYTWKRLCLNST